MQTRQTRSHQGLLPAWSPGRKVGPTTKLCLHSEIDGNGEHPRLVHTTVLPFIEGSGILSSRFYHNCGLDLPHDASLPNYERVSKYPLFVSATSLGLPHHFRRDNKLTILAFNRSNTQYPTSRLFKFPAALEYQPRQCRRPPCALHTPIPRHHEIASLLPIYRCSRARTTSPQVYIQGRSLHPIPMPSAPRAHTYPISSKQWNRTPARLSIP